MIESQKTKIASMVVPQTIGTSAVSGYVDTLGWDHCTVFYHGDTAAAADVITTLKLQHGDTTSEFTDVSGAVGGTDFTIPAPNTSTPDFVKFEFPRDKGMKRYVNVSVVGDATVRNTTVFAVLSRGEAGPDTDAEAGCAEVVYV